MRSVVVLPQPDGPSMQVKVCGASSKARSRMTTISPPAARSKVFSSMRTE